MSIWDEAEFKWLRGLRFLSLTESDWEGCFAKVVEETNIYSETFRRQLQGANRCVQEVDRHLPL